MEQYAHRFLVYQDYGGVAAEGIQKAVEEENGKFISIDDFQIKSKVGKSIIEMLTKFDCLKGMSKSNQLSLFDF